MAEPQNPLTPAIPRIVASPSRNLPTPDRVLAIGAHPDDVDFGAGGTLAKWAADGCEVSMLVLTDGSKGTWDPTVDPASLVLARQQEQRAAAQALGASGDIVFLGWPDGELDSGLRQRWQISYWIRKLRPTVVLGHDPWKRYRLHPDHRHAGWLTTDGVVAARDPLFFPEQNLPHFRPDALLLWEADEADHAEDITGFVDHKYEALASHHSQFESTMLATDDAGMAVFRDRMREKSAAAGALVGMDHAEVFKLIDDL